MPIQRDPEEIETKHLHNVADLTNARVLEIGCGEGRLTWRYAASAGYVVGIDLNPGRLEIAHLECPPTLRSGVAFVEASAETLPFRHESFDLAILAWSL